MTLHADAGGNRAGGGVLPTTRAHEKRVLTTKQTMAARLWDLDWALPCVLDGVTLELGTFADASPFIRDHYAAIFGADDTSSRFLIEPMTAAKLRFGEEMDVVLFRAEGKTVGVAAGHPLDWSSYYVRTLAILPEYRERRLCSDYTVWISETLTRAGVARLETECSPANIPLVRMLLSAGFLLTNTAPSERWGMTARFTKFLSDEAGDAFHRQFLNVPAYGRHPRPKERRKP